MSKIQLAIIPCCGIDSVYGLLSQEVAFEVAKECDRSNSIIGLSYLVTGDPESEDAISEDKCIVINGCSKECASNVVDFLGGEISLKYTIACLNAGNDVGGLGTAMELTENGQNLVCQIKNNVINEIRVLTERGDEQ